MPKRLKFTPVKLHYLKSKIAHPMPKMQKYISFLLFSLVIINSSCSQSKKLVLDQVDPFIGTGGHGHTYPGVSMPFGLVQLSPDTDDTGWDWCSGYNYIDESIMGFSHTHLSGTGISDLADILVMPFCGPIVWEPGEKTGKGQGYRSPFSHQQEISTPGRYSVQLLKHGIKAELTASHEVGYHRYTFPASDASHIIIDLLHGLDRKRTWLTERVLDSEIKVINNTTISGFRTSSGWANVQKVYFQLEFSKPFDINNLATNGTVRTNSSLARGRNVKGVFSFKTQKDEQIVVKVKIALSPINFFENKITFDEATANSKKAWQKELSSIKIEAPDSIQKIFYTALYHTALSPNILDNESTRNESAKNASKLEVGTLSQWDVYRASFALNTILRPQIVDAIVGTMVRSYKANGYLPVWKLWGDEVNCMIGTPSVPIACEAIAKGLVKDEDELLEAIDKTLRTDNPVAPWSTFDRFKYIPYDMGEAFSVSKTLEMSYANGCAAMIASSRNDKKNFEYYNSRASYIENLFDKNIGFFRGKSQKGQWSENFDPSVTNEKEFVEATPWQYLFHTQHDIPSLIKWMGGKQNFTNKLDALFEAKEGKIDEHILDITGLIGQYAHGNEPSHHVSYLYNYADQPWKTQEKINQICKEFYNTTPNGLCGNEDCGQMSAWYIFSTLGFYPVHPTSGLYDLGAPQIAGATINLPNGNTFEIKTKNYSAANIYVKNVTLNGKRLSKPFLSHSDLMKGGVLEFEMSKGKVMDCYEEE